MSSKHDWSTCIARISNDDVVKMVLNAKLLADEITMNLLLCVDLFVRCGDLEQGNQQTNE